ncbi:MAG: flagellar basal body P-ring formation chaperone FlgA [Pseudomonadota bacterium]|nr:flagellar basal body P-ring formation chaperone FlgA [Pseudomonadota bacterium]
MERHGARLALYKFVGPTTLRKLKVMAFALFFLTILNSNAGMDSDANSNLDYPSVDAIANFKVQLSTWRESQGHLVGLKIKLDRRFKAPECAGPYSFSVIKDSIGLVRAECHSPKWLRVLKTSKERSSSNQNRQTDKVWVASTEIASGQILTNKRLKKVSIDSRQIPRNALKRLPATRTKANRTIKPGEIILTSSIYEPKYGFVAKTTIPSGSFLKPGLISKELIEENSRGDILENARGIEFMAANRTILAGNPIRSQDLRKARLVRRGDQVKLVSSGGGFTVSSKTIALEDGYLDEQIRLLGEDGKREIRAKISGISSAIALK